MKTLLTFIRNITPDLVALAGLGLVSAGLYMVYPPAALIVPGLVFFAVGALVARGRGRRR